MKTWYSKQGLWTLFLMCAVLLHLWALIMIARDISWLTERTNAWDAVGNASYGLFYILVESILLFAVTCLLGFLTPRSWTVERRIAFLSMLVLVLVVWAMLEQLYFLTGTQLPGGLLGWLSASGHPLRILYLAAALLVIPSVLLPALWVVRSERSLRILGQVFERLSMLAGLYLFLDLLAILTILLRNVA